MFEVSAVLTRVYFALHRAGIPASAISTVIERKRESKDPATVQPVGLTVFASYADIGYGTAPPSITPYSYEGFVNGDSASSLSTQPTCTTTATSSSPAGTYPSSCSGAVDANYNITYVPGAVTVLRVPLTVTASSGSIEPGGTVPTVTPIYSGFVNGDGHSSLPTQPTCSTSATSSSAV